MQISKYIPTFIFHPHEHYRPCTLEALVGIASSEQPLYYVHNAVERYITYILMYMRDTGNACGLGKHKWDVEFVRVYYDSDRITKAYYSAHSSDQGTWVDGDKLEYIDNSPVVYVSKGTHAHYPRCKTIWRIFGFANDRVGRGETWKPTVLKELEDPNGILREFDQYTYSDFKGALGGWFRFLYPVSKWLY